MCSTTRLYTNIKQRKILKLIILWATRSTVYDPIGKPNNFAQKQYKTVFWTDLL